MICLRRGSRTQSRDGSEGLTFAVLPTGVTGTAGIARETLQVSMRLPVLLLDSDTDAAMQFAAQLRHSGFAIEIVSSTSEALDLLGYRVCSIVVVVADLLDDDEFQQSLTDLRHAAPKAWMLVVTDDPPQRAREIVRQCGADELFVTPFAVAVFIKYLAMHIRLPRPLS